MYVEASLARKTTRPSAADAMWPGPDRPGPHVSKVGRLRRDRAQTRSPVGERSARATARAVVHPLTEQARTARHILVGDENPVAVHDRRAVVTKARSRQRRIAVE